MKISNIFLGKKNRNPESLPEVDIAGPKSALARLENNSNILKRRDQILANANQGRLGQGILGKSQKLPLNILEGNDNYKRDGLELEDNEILSSSFKEDSFIPNNLNESIDLIVNPAPPNPHHKPIDYYEDEQVKNHDVFNARVEEDPFDESTLESGYTEVMVILTDGNHKKYLFNISKSKFEQQWLDEIHSIGIFTAKDIYGNMVTLSPLDKGSSIAFEIKEGKLPGIL